jgi:hypothetical protein
MANDRTNLVRRSMLKEQIGSAVAGAPNLAGDGGSVKSRK